MGNQKDSAGLLAFILLAIIGVALIIYAIFESGNVRPTPMPTEIPKPTYLPAVITQAPTVIATLAVGGDEPPPLPPG
ncbi:MAG: hypothetical protein ABH863_00790 [Candidatus Micrarchaeota archaeon]